MAQNLEKQRPVEPRGFGPHTRGLSGEYAHEQGWGLEIDERTKIAASPQNTNGGTDYKDGRRDFGDEPVNNKLNLVDQKPAQNGS